MTKRVYVYLNGTNKNGVCIPITSMNEMLQNLHFKKHPEISFNKNLRIFTSNGCDLYDLTLLKDEETIYVSNGDDFIHLKCDLRENLKASDWISLNVGGKIFTTTRATLTLKEPESMLAKMFSITSSESYKIQPSFKDETQAFLIDRSPKYFEPLLDYLRHGTLILDKYLNPQGVLEEAKFFGIDSIVPQLEALINNESINKDGHPLTRQDVVKALIETQTSSKLRFQGVNLMGADLGRLDLSNINFKYANLSKCNLSGSNMSMCLLERADLSYSNMEGTQLLGVKALCANLEGANLKGCNMEDPSGANATFEGVNLKGANLEGSNMAGVNLRVATLKNANLKNCDLRTAVLAGANLENCDLSGSDLHEANLRGANLKDTAFEFMLTPLHMSQTIR